MDAQDTSTQKLTDSALEAQTAARNLQSPHRDDVDDRYSAVTQYSLAKVIGVWAAAAIPMAVLAWVVAPWLRDQLSGEERLAKALLICLTAGLIWQFVL